MRRVLAVFTVVLATMTMVACSNDDSMPRNNGPTGPTPSFVGLQVTEGDASGTIIANGAVAGGQRNFGSINVGNSSSALTITIANPGIATLTLGLPTSAGTNPGDFVINSTATSQSLLPGETTTFTVTFTPASSGSRTGQIRLTHNVNETASPYLFNVSGMGNSVP
jgi:hypothetical protein